MSKHRTISELAEATGVSAATLRAWEKRHGFRGDAIRQPIAAALRDSVQALPPSIGPDPEFVTALTRRMVAYLDR